MSSSYVRMCAKILELSVSSGSYVPRPKTGCSLRRATKRWSQRRTEVGVRSLLSRPPTLEELFLRHYRRAADPDPAGEKVAS